MNQTSLYGFCLTVCLAIAGILTTGTTQTTLFVAAAAATAALMLATLVGNRARDKAREEFRARYGEYPS